MRSRFREEALRRSLHAEQTVNADGTITQLAGGIGGVCRACGEPLRPEERVRFRPGLGGEGHVHDRCAVAPREEEL